MAKPAMLLDLSSTSKTTSWQQILDEASVGASSRLELELMFYLHSHNAYYLDVEQLLYEQSLFLATNVSVFHLMAQTCDTNN